MLYGSEAGPVMARYYRTRKEIFDKLLMQAEPDPHATTKRVTLVQEYGESFAIDVSSFSVPKDIRRSMRKSEKRFFAHHWKIKDHNAAVEAARNFVKRSVAKCINHKILDTDVLTKVIFKYTTVSAQKNYAANPEDRFLVELLHFWTAARLIEGGFSFDDSETLGLGKGATLARAPLLDEQLAVLLVDDVLTPIRQRVISRLDHIITHKRKERWLDLVLATFVLLHHYSLAMIHQWNFARRRKAANSGSPDEFVNRLHAGARCLLVHFHVVCGGHKPFVKTWIDELTKEGKSEKMRKQLKKLTTQFGDKDADFLRLLIDERQKKMDESEQLALNDEHEDSHFLTSRMFIPDYDPQKQSATTEETQ